MELTKKYRILYRNNDLLMLIGEYSSDSVTYVGNDVDAFETDNKMDAEQFIKENNLSLIDSGLEAIENLTE